MKPGMSVERKIRRLQLQIDFYRKRPEKKKWITAIERRLEAIEYLKQNGNINWTKIRKKFNIIEV